MALNKERNWSEQWLAIFEVGFIPHSFSGLLTVSLLGLPVDISFQSEVVPWPLDASPKVRVSVGLLFRGVTTQRRLLNLPSHNLHVTTSKLSNTLEEVNITQLSCILLRSRKQPNIKESKNIDCLCRAKSMTPCRQGNVPSSNSLVMVSTRGTF